MTPWTYQEPTGPKLDITKPKSYNWNLFPYGEDDRDPAEIEQLQFEQMQQRWEFEREQEAGRNTTE